MNRRFTASSVALALVLATNQVFAQFVFPLTLEQCQTCCTNAANEFDFNFDLATCLGNNGCGRPESEARRCDQVFGSNQQNQRNGCELSRDFLVTGVTALLDSTKILQCDFKGNIFEIDLQVPPANNFIIGANQCASCCDDMNSRFDPGNDDTQDDFRGATCQDVCNNPDFCFEDPEHFRRAGCLYGVDFRVNAITTFLNQIFVCDDNGKVVNLPLTDFPTAAPTNVNDDGLGDGAVIFLSLFGILSFLTFLSILAFIVLKRNKRQAYHIERNIHEEARFPNQMYPKQKLSIPETATTTTVASSPNRNVVIKIEIPAEEASRPDFDINRYLPKASNVGSNQGSSFDEFSMSDTNGVQTEEATTKKRRRRRKKKLEEIEEDEQPAVDPELRGPRRRTPQRTYGGQSPRYLLGEQQEEQNENQYGSPPPRGPAQRDTPNTLYQGFDDSYNHSPSF